eukprot:TRINITY_DN60881_c0_g1_i1.p2 TRINITY_DN60881_c0_g1~~TRINITY_DN60881_c0_g1_i1.p2  ORF type:complete len:531 (+),score=169.87 TRINITY_DN60881_c0_g1_i1:76-1593(+)
MPPPGAADQPPWAAPPVRLLCLHGAGETAGRFGGEAAEYAALRLLQGDDLLRGRVSLHFAEAPLIPWPLPSGATARVPAWCPPAVRLDPGYASGSRAGELLCVTEEAAQVLRRTCEQHGPFDGFLGFSQGAALAAVLAALAEGGELPWLQPPGLLCLLSPVPCDPLYHFPGAGSTLRWLPRRLAAPLSFVGSGVQERSAAPPGGGPRALRLLLRRLRGPVHVEHNGGHEIPAAFARPLASWLLHAAAALRRAGAVGAELSEGRQLSVTALQPGGAADAAGIRVGDRVLWVASRPGAAAIEHVRSAADFRAALSPERGVFAHSAVRVGIERGGQQLQLRAVLGDDTRRQRAASHRALSVLRCADPDFFAADVDATADLVADGVWLSQRLAAALLDTGGSEEGSAGGWLDCAHFAAAVADFCQQTVGCRDLVPPQERLRLFATVATPHAAGGERASVAELLPAAARAYRDAVEAATLRAVRPGGDAYRDALRFPPYRAAPCSQQRRM